MIKRAIAARNDARRRSDGFTLLEVLVAISLIAVVLTLSVGALRHFWLVRALTSSTDDVLTQLRSTQENAVSESYPVVYGVRFDVDEQDWHVLRYDPKNAGAGDDTCTVFESYSLSDGVEIDAASFATDPVITDFCRAETSAPATASFVFFYPRGNATPGDVVLEHAGIDRSATVDVSALTGRVTKQ